MILDRTGTVPGNSFIERLHKERRNLCVFFRVNDGKADRSKADRSKADHSKADRSKADRSKADCSKADRSKADCSKADRSKADCSKADHCGNPRPDIPERRT